MPGPSFLFHMTSRPQGRIYCSSRNQSRIEFGGAILARGATDLSELRPVLGPNVATALTWHSQVSGTQDQHPPCRMSPQNAKT